MAVTVSQISTSPLDLLELCDEQHLQYHLSTEWGFTGPVKEYLLFQHVLRECDGSWDVRCWSSTSCSRNCANFFHLVVVYLQNAGG
jgi:hypothetical protein